MNIAIFDFANVNSPAPDLVKIYLAIMSQMNWIMGLIRPDRPELYAIELKELLYLTFFTLLHLQI